MKAKKTQREPYLKIPQHILHIPQLGLPEKVLLGHIYSFGEKGCWQSNQTLAEHLVVSVPMIRRLLGRLKDYIHVANPKGYYRTIWAEEVLKNEQGPAQNRGSDLRISANRLAHGRATTSNNTIGANNRRTIASPSPLPTGGQAPATLNEQRRCDIAVIERFKATFGRPDLRERRPLTPEQFEARRAAVLAGLHSLQPAGTSSTPRDVSPRRKSEAEKETEQ